MLECKDASLYTGVTNSPKKRFEKHLKGEAAKYTRAKKPKKVVWLKEFEGKSAAMQKEAEVKSWSRQEKLKLVKDFDEVDIQDF